LAGPKTAKVVLRGAFNRITNWTPSSTTVPFGIVPANALGINFPTTIGVAPWDATIAGTSTSLMVPSTTLTYYTPAGTVSGSAVTVTTTTAPGPRWINFLGSLYGLGYGAASTLTDAGSTYTINASAVLKSALNSGSGGFSSQSLVFNPGSPSTPGMSQTQDSSGTVSWTDTTYGSSWNTPQSGGTWANNAVTNILTFSNLGFSIPSGTTILGISVVADGFGDYYTNPTAPVDSLAELVGGTGTPANYAAFKKQQSHLYGTVNTYGGSTSLWGQTWTPAQINSSSFGFKWQLMNNSGASQTYSNSFYGGIGTQFTITVYYYVVPAYAAPTTLTGAPTGAVDITQYQSRLWLAQGCDVPGGGTYHEPTTVFWTNPVTSTNPLTNTTADWRYTDPVSGTTTTNKVVIDNNGADPVMGFGRVAGAMVIFRRSSVYVLKGTTTANYQIIKISGNVGCLDPRSIVEADEGVYFMSLQGLMLTNGNRISSVSTGVEQALQSSLSYEQAVVLSGSANHQSGWISCGITSQGHVAVSVGVMGNAAAAVPLPNDVGTTLTATAMRTIWSGVYDPGVGSWYRLTSFLFGLDSGMWSESTFIGVPDLPQLFVSNRLVGQRSLHVVGNGGITTLEDQALGSSYLTSSALFDVSQSTLTSPESGVVQGVGIPARWHTKMAPLIGTSSIDRRYGMPKRFFLDHALAVGLGSGGTTPSWVVTPYDSDGVAYPITLSCATSSSSAPTDARSGPSVVAPVAGNTILRDNQDFSSEVSNLTFDISLPAIESYTSITTGGPVLGPSVIATLPNNVVGELYGIGLEYQTSHDLRTKVT
jgi:hypothetical protein